MVPSTTYKQPRGPLSKKRDSPYLILHSPSKRFKAVETQDSASWTHSSQSKMADRAGHLKAEKWFEDTNKNASRDVPFVDNDPPFYMDHQPSSDGNSARAVRSDGSSPRHSTLGKPTAPTRSLLARMESSESNSEDFRSVIDDLTIQNKELKKKLKQYEKLHCSHLQEEKLFEVRIHGLASDRRRELEETLRRFASSIEEMSSEYPALDSLLNSHPKVEPRPQGDFQTIFGDRISSVEPMSALCKPSSASTSYSKPIDSAYASMSGQTGTSHLQVPDKGRFRRRNQVSQKQQNVQSYLHEISETLAPKHSRPMSIRSKSKIVVKRLEELFTGKGERSRHHTQSHQQQEVSQSAARADQIRQEDQGHGRRTISEGVREARILSDDVDLQVDSLCEATTAAQQSQQRSHDGRDPTRRIQASRDQSPNQRPTRPLDLDLHRAQVPSENIDYIRHLGLSSPAGPSNLDTDDGWVYLNLLTSMAQLHTLNVTPTFIRQSVSELSSKFELSIDGTKVRWLGGGEGTRLSSDSDGSSDVDQLSSLDDRRSFLNTSSKGIRGTPGLGSDLHRPSHEPSIDLESAAQRHPIFLKQANNAANFHYKPLFFHGVPSEQGDLDMATDSVASSDIMENATGLNSGINSGSHGLRETELKLRKHNTENGPIIFYHKARFCTDLSGDPSGTLMDENAYFRFSEDPLGCPPGRLDERKGSHEDARVDAMETESTNDGSASPTLDLDDLRSCISDCLSSTSSMTQAPFPMEASGLYGIQPDDNFVIKVQVRHRRKRRRLESLSPERAHRALDCLHRPYSAARPKAQDVSQSQPSQISFSGEITYIEKTCLQPSSLPTPSYVRLPFSSSGSEDDEGADEPPSPYSHHNGRSGSREALESCSSGPPKFGIDSSPEELKESCYESTSGSDDDSSIDLLAHARVLDPDAIAARERDFENNAPPPGSVAATAGESSESPISVQRVESDVDSMSIHGNGSGMDDSE